MVKDSFNMFGQQCGGHVILLFFWPTIGAQRRKGRCVCASVFRGWPSEGQRRRSGGREPYPGPSTAAGSCGGIWNEPCWTPWCRWGPPPPRNGETPASGNLQGDTVGEGEKCFMNDWRVKTSSIPLMWTHRRSAGSAAGWASPEPRCTGGSSGLHSLAKSRPGLWCWCPQWQRNSWGKSQ